MTGFDLGNHWQNQSAFDGRYYDVAWRPEDVVKVNALYDAAIAKHWAIWREKVEQTTSPQALGPTDFDFVWEGDGLAGAVLRDVYWDEGGIDKLSAVFSGRMGDSPNKEEFELFMAEQIRERLSIDVEQLAKAITDPNARKAAEQWAHDLFDMDWI